MNMDISLTVDAFVRSIAVNRGKPICLLLGAGASMSSGMPSAERCIWEWKKDIFVTNNPTLRDSVGELSLPGTKRRIQAWMDARGAYPSEGHPNEYSFYAKECYPTGQDRRAFFQSYVSKAKPHIGYRLLPLLAKGSLVRSVWTTNFDGLVARASAAANLSCIEVGIDTPQRTQRQQAEGELRLVSMHGDYRYDDLKNTTAELQNQEAFIREELLHELRDYDLVVMGYSGRDASVMAVLHDAYSGASPSRLFWCGYGDDIPSPVEALIAKAHELKKDAFYVSTQGFDDVIARLALRQLEGDLLAESKRVLDSAAGSSSSATSVFTVPQNPATSLIKSNAYPLTVPTHAAKCAITIPVGENRRHWLDNRFPPEVGALMSMDEGVLAFADVDDLEQAFGAALQSNPVTVALSAEDIAKDGRICSLLRRALVQSLATLLGSRTDGNRLLWEPVHYEERKIQNSIYRVHAAVSFKLESILGKPHVALMPEVVGYNLDGTPASVEACKKIRIEVYGYQHNKVYDANLKYWTERLTNIDAPAKGGGCFRVGRAPIYAGLFQKSRAALPKNLQDAAKQKGMVIQDANLVFSSLNGKIEVRDPNPLKGLVQNRPWDYGLTTSGLASAVEIAAICPSPYSAHFSRFLSQLQEHSEPSSSERDYLQTFPGFSNAFGLPLTCPSRGDNSWVDMDDAVSGDALACVKQLAHRICKALDMIRARRPGAVVGIFVPKTWAPH